MSPTAAVGGARAAADDRFVLRSDRLLWREIDEEVVALDLPTSTYLSANVTGALLLNGLREGASARELVQSLCAEFNVGETDARDDVATFLGQLLERDLVERLS